MTAQAAGVGVGDVQVVGAGSIVVVDVIDLLEFARIHLAGRKPRRVWSNLTTIQCNVLGAVTVLNAPESPGGFFRGLRVWRIVRF